MIKAVFEPVSPDWERKPYFDYYYNTIKSKYNINYHIDITELLSRVKDQSLRFYPTFMYVIMRIVNQNKEFRMSFDENKILGTWSFVIPSYTIFHNDNKTFSDIWSEYTPVFKDFYNQVVEDENTYKDVKKIRAKENRPPNFCPISAVPWLSFQSISQDTYSESPLLFPIIRFGKYYKHEDKVLLPFSIFVNHAVADGYHTSKLINEIEDLCKRSKEWLSV
jgi:chloramphenicol O-acetyltransferase type A